MSTTFPEDLSGPSAHLVKITTNEAFDKCRALWVGTAGTATITTNTGAILTNFPLKEGPNPISCRLVALGTAADVWAMY